MIAVPPHEVRVRLAPSPTGPFHFGTARTGLFNWLYARQHKGKFILRIEDTDEKRSEKKYEAEIAEGLLWLGLFWDEGPEGYLPRRLPKARGERGSYRQSERKEIYRKYLTKLLDEEKAYYCYCRREELEAERQTMLGQGLPPKYSGHCRNLSHPPKDRKPEVIRFKTAETVVEFKDMIRGTVRFDTSLFGDIVIAKDIDTPLYNFAAVVDDEEMKISHVIRGEDHLSNTPKQILLQKALGFTEPRYAHLPLILGPDRSKLSKRFAETSLLEYRRRGYLAEAAVNFLALLGWHPTDDKEIFTTEELVARFDIKRVQKSGAIFNEEKLEWINAQHLRRLSDEEIINRLRDVASDAYKPLFKREEFLKKVVAVERERVKTLADFFDLAGFFFELADYDPKLLIWQKEQPAKIKKLLEEILAALRDIDARKFTAETLRAALRMLIEKEGRGGVLWPLRVALSGRTASPDPFDIMEVLGLKESARRITIAIEKLEMLVP